MLYGVFFYINFFSSMTFLFSCISEKEIIYFCIGFCRIFFIFNKFSLLFLLSFTLSNCNRLMLKVKLMLNYFYTIIPFRLWNFCLMQRSKRWFYTYIYDFFIFNKYHCFFFFWTLHLIIVIIWCLKHKFMVNYFHTICPFSSMKYLFIA